MTSRRWLTLALLGAAVALLVGRGFATLYADYLWFSALGAPEVWRARTVTLLVLRGVSAVLGGLFGPVSTGRLQVRWITLAAIGVTAVALLVLLLLLYRTSLGLHMRAASADFQTARLLGVQANRVITAAVAMSGVLAAIVAVILTVQTPFVTPDFALRDTIVVLVGVVVGGLDRLWTATLGGFTIGFATSVLGEVLPAS